MGDLMFRWLKLSLVALVACGFIGMVVYALWMRDEIRSAQVDPALVAAPDSAAKRRPDEPGGLEIPNRDKMVFDLLDEASTGVSAPAPAPVAGTVEQLPLAGAATPTLVVSPATAQEVAVPVMPASAPAAAPVVAQAAPQPLRESKPEAKSISAPPSQPQPQAETAAGKWGVQVAAVGSQADAAKMAKTLQGKFPALKNLTVATPDAGNGHWRVQFFGLASKAAAGKVCDNLKGKQACFPVSQK